MNGTTTSPTQSLIFQPGTCSELDYDMWRTRLCGSEHVANSTSSETGVNQNDPRYFKGKIAEMKVYDVALNDAQIQISIIQGN